MRLKVAMPDTDPIADVLPVAQISPANAAPYASDDSAFEVEAPMLPAEDGRPTSYRRLRPEHGQLTRVIGRGRTAALVPRAGLGEGTSLCLSLCSDDNASGVHWSDPMTLAGAFGAIEFSDGGRLVRALCGIDIGARPADSDARTTWLHAAILGRLQDTPLAGADRILLGLPVAAQATVALQLAIRSPLHAVTMYARATPSAWLAFLSPAVWKAEQAPAREHPTLPVDLPVLLGRHHTTAQTVRALLAGDIVLPDTAHFACNGEGFIRAGNWRMQVIYRAPGSLEIVGVEKRMEHLEPQEEQLMHHENEDPVEDTAPVHRQPAAAFAEASGAVQESPGVDDLPVTLDFALGRIRLSLGELQTLGAGVVLELESGSPAAVAITSSGHKLGIGEAVDVNGRIGIRIIQWGGAL